VKQILNTLYITTERAYAHLDYDAVRVDIDGATQLRVPLHHLGAIVCFGDVLVSPGLIERCAEDGRALVFLSPQGRFRARVEGPKSGNVLLRRAQYDASADAARAAAIARQIVAAKVQNARQVLLRGAREAEQPEFAAELEQAAERLASLLDPLRALENLDEIRGVEGEAARTYFAVLDRMVLADRQAFLLRGRSRRPPLDPMDSLLSFLYTLLLNDCVAAAEGVGLDPQVGFLHALRPGRPSLALDLMEELRAILADRVALTLVNRRQVTADDFAKTTGGAIHLSDRARKEVILSYQARKQDEVQHPVVEEKAPLGFVPHVQARLLARHLRGDLELYPPFLYR
jgi:CRISP-associated protein Cas1